MTKIHAIGLLVHHTAELIPARLDLGLSLVSAHLHRHTKLARATNKADG
jgi:hypothetical protein